MPECVFDPCQRDGGLVINGHMTSTTTTIKADHLNPIISSAAKGGVGARRFACGEYIVIHAVPLVLPPYIKTVSKRQPTTLSAYL